MLNGEVVEVIKNVRYLKKQTQISILCFIRYLIEIEENLAVTALTMILVTMLMPDAKVNRKWMLSTKMANTVIDIFKFLPTHFVSNRDCFRQKG